MRAGYAPATRVASTWPSGDRPATTRRPLAGLAQLTAATAATPVFNGHETCSAQKSAWNRRRASPAAAADPTAAPGR